MIEIIRLFVIDRRKTSRDIPAYSRAYITMQLKTWEK